MPQFHVTDPDSGQTLTLEGDSTPTEEELNHVFKEYKAPEAPAKTSAAGAAGRGFLTGLLPTGAAVATAVGLEAAAAPESLGTSLLLIPPTLAAGWLAGKLQQKGIHAAAPEFEQLQQADVEQHPWASTAGSVAAALPFAQVSPGAILSPKRALVPAAVGATVGAAMPLVEGRRPTLPDIVGGAAGAALFGKARFGPTRPVAPRTPQDASGGIQTPSGGRTPLEAATATQESLPLQGLHPDLEAAKASVESDNVKVVASPVDPETNEPFAVGKLATIKRNLDGTGEIHVSPEAHAWLMEDVIPEKRPQAARTLLGEERNHLATSTEDALKYTGTLTALEKGIERKLYPGGEGLDDTQLGFEAVRRRLQRLARMDTTETVSTVGRERWKLKSLEALNDTVRGIRERLGTKASKEGLAILDRVQGNLEAGIVALGGRPSTRPSADDLLNIKPEEVSAWLKQIKYSGEDAAKWAAKMTPEDIAKLSAESQRLREETSQAMAEMGKGETFDQSKMTKALQSSLKAQTLREVVEDYGKQPAARRNKPPKEHPELMLPPIAGERASAAALGAKPYATEPYLSPDKVDFEGRRQTAFRPISDAEAASPTALAKVLTEGSRAEGSNRPESQSNTVTVLLNKRTGALDAVSTYRHSRAGAMLADPALMEKGAARPHRPLAEILKDYKPLYSVLLKEPVQNFHERFNSMREFQEKFGNAATEAASQHTGAAPESPGPHQAEQYAMPVESEPAAIEPPQASAVGDVHDFFQGNLPKTIKEFQARLRSSGGSASKGMVDVVRRLMELEKVKDPNIAVETSIENALNKIYEDLTTNQDKGSFTQKLMGRFTETPAQDVGLAGQGQAKAEKSGQAIGNDPRGNKAEPAAMRNTVRAAKDEIDRVSDAVKLLTTRRDMIGSIAKTIDETGNTTNIEGTQAENNIRLASATKAPGLKGALSSWQRGKKEVLHAANAMVEAQFDKSKLPGFLDDLAQARANATQMAQGGTWRERRLAKAYLRDIDASEAEVKYAQDHWNDPELRGTATRVKMALDNQYSVEKAKGFDLTKEEGYVPHRLLGVWGGAETLFQLPRVLGTKYRMPRTFDTHYEALAAGPYMRVTHDIASLVGHRVRQGMGNINRHEWKAGLLATTFPDGTPMALEPKMGPHGPQSPSPAYKVIDTNGLGHLAVHEDIYKPLRNLLSPSYFDDAPIARNVLHFEQMLKHSLLIGDFFHLARMGYFGASIIGKQVLGGGKAGWSVLDIAERNIPEAVRKGIISQKDADWANTKVNGLTRRQLVELAYKQNGANLGKIQDALYKDLLTDLTPTAGPIRRGLSQVMDPTAGRYNRFLFEKLTRGLMAESIVKEFERQTKAKPDASPDALMRDISKDVNERFGNIGRQGIFKSKTAQDFARLLFLAPQWVEGLATTEARAYSRLSGVSSVTGQRKGVTALGTTGTSVGKAMVFMFGLTQAINLITRGKPTWQNDEDGHKLDAWIPSIGSDGEGFWFNPLSVFNEVSHDIYRMTEAKLQQDKPVGDVVTDILANKESPISRALLVMGTGKTPRGERITSTANRFLSEPAKAIAPMPITFGRFAQAGGHALAPGMVPPVPQGQMQRQVFGSAGLKIEPALSAPGNVRRMADKFMRESGLKKETGWEQVQNDMPSYTKLREAIRNNDNSRAAKILNDLRKGRSDGQIKRAMRNHSRMPFTGSSKAEKQFLGSLDDKGLEKYQRAREQLMADFNVFAEWYNTLP